MSILVIPYRHEWTVSLGKWAFGVVEVEPTEFFGSGTIIYFGPIGSIRLGHVSAPVVASAFGLTCAVIVAFIAVRFVFRPRRTPSP